METGENDVRWRQRLDNFSRALATVRRLCAPIHGREPSEVEQLALIQGFELTHELAWNLLKDYLEHQGFTGIMGSRDATRLAFKHGLIGEGETWMDMIRTRNLTSHTYDQELARVVAVKVMQRFCPAFSALEAASLAWPGQQGEEP